MGYGDEYTIRLIKETSYGGKREVEMTVEEFIDKFVSPTISEHLSTLKVSIEDMKGESDAQ